MLPSVSRAEGNRGLCNPARASVEPPRPLGYNSTMWRPEKTETTVKPDYSPTSSWPHKYPSIPLFPSSRPCQFAEMIRQRRPAGDEPDPCSGTGSPSHAATSGPGVIDQSREPGHRPGEQRPLLKTKTIQVAEADGMTWAQRNHWIVLAVASGACAAFNGVFAKLYVFPQRGLAGGPLVWGCFGWLTMG